MEPQLHWYQSHTKTQRGKNFWISLMDTSAKLCNSLLKNQIQEQIIKTICHYQVDFIPGMQGWFNIQKSISIIHYLNNLKEKHYMIISCWESIWQNSTSIYNQSLGKIRNSWPIPKHSKINIQQTCSQHQTKGRETGSNLTKMRESTRLPSKSLPIQYCTQSPSQSN